MNNRHRWNPNWDRAIIALAQHETFTAAAASLGIDRVTLYRYTKNPEFHSQLLRTLAFVNTAARTKLEAQSCGVAPAVIRGSVLAPKRVVLGAQAFRTPTRFGMFSDPKVLSTKDLQHFQTFSPLFGNVP